MEEEFRTESVSGGYKVKFNEESSDGYRYLERIGSKFNEAFFYLSKAKDGKPAYFKDGDGRDFALSYSSGEFLLVRDK